MLLSDALPTRILSEEPRLPAGMLVCALDPQTPVFRMGLGQSDAFFCLSLRGSSERQKLAVWEQKIVLPSVCPTHFLKSRLQNGDMALSTERDTGPQSCSFSGSATLSRT